MKVKDFSCAFSNYLGKLAAFATASDVGGHIVKSFTEHCTIIGLASVREDLNYQQGVNRMWFRSTRFDFYWPALAHIGEQAVLNQEIWLASATNTNVFGYNEAWSEYRYKPSIITGKFRSDASGTLDVWHLAQEFTAPPVLGEAFIQADTPMDRVLAVGAAAGGAHFIFDSVFKIRAVRPLPMYSVPGLIQRF